jgi:nucleoside-diphosphate kinase
MERTFVALKPDIVRRGLVGEIIRKFENKGYKIIAMKMIHVDEELAAKHYEEHIGKPFYDGLVKFITNAPIVAMVLQGENVIESVRKFFGKTNPLDAEDGSIRSDYAQITRYNSVHASDSVESAQREINLYFKPEEICNNWKTTYELMTEEINNG